MEVIKELKFYICKYKELIYNPPISKLKLIKSEEEYLWWFTTPLVYFDFIRYNNIIRPLNTSYINGSTFRFFEKDLADNSDDVAYLQDNIDSHFD